MNNPWVRRWTRESGPPALQLVCFAHAGGGAGSFRGWAPLLPPSVELLAVQYPGREDRSGEEFARTVEDLVGDVTAALLPVLRTPYVVFGHSMGALLAHDVTHALVAAGAPVPHHLVVSGRRPPQDDLGGRLHLGDDEDLVAEVVRLGGTSPEVLADEGFRRLVLGYVRADYRLVETYVPRRRVPLTCPVTAYVGDADPEVTPQQAARWADVTAAGCDVRTFPGDHFYLVPQRRAVVADLLRRTAPDLVRPEWPETP
ncbi:thioesterase II family protein [Kineococcus sp. TBRC 1896]|uniref:Thioesterase II family protein n=1 Tax=Kineococcus mangrovi TaxID=1660183 RepID=A0ABV4I068_9ACTN